MKKYLTIIAATMAVSGGAFAASDSTSAVDAVMNSKTVMSRFYTDDSMTTMKSGADFKSAAQEMSPADRGVIAAACAGQNSMHENFCNAFGDAIKGM